jgi:hypothetical protein
MKLDCEIHVSIFEILKIFKEKIKFYSNEDLDKAISEIQKELNFREKE